MEPLDLDLVEDRAGMSDGMFWTSRWGLAMRDGCVVSPNSQSAMIVNTVKLTLTLFIVYHPGPVPSGRESARYHCAVSEYDPRDRSGSSISSTTLYVTCPRGRASVI